MSIATMLLTVIAVLIFFGVLQRVLDRMYLTDRAALLLVAAMFIGTLLPNLTIGRVSINLGGAVIPLGVCVFLLIKADSSWERVRPLIGALLTAAAVWGLSWFLPDEPEKMWMDPTLLYGLSAGIIACALGRSRRGAFICGVLGVMLADVVTALINWGRGIDQQLVLGGAGLADVVVISGVLAVALTELVSEIMERFSRARHAHGKERS